MKIKRKLLLGITALLPFHLTAQDSPIVDLVCDEVAQPIGRKEPCVERSVSSPSAGAQEDSNRNTASESSKKFDIKALLLSEKISSISSLPLPDDI